MTFSPDKITELKRSHPHLFAAQKATEARAEEVFDDAVAKFTVERELQNSAYKWLLLNGATGIVWHAMSAKTTCHKGVSDFIFCWKGRYVAAEAKVGNRRQTSQQADFLLNVKAAGGVAFVFRSLDELKANLL